MAYCNARGCFTNKRLLSREFRSKKDGYLGGIASKVDFKKFDYWQWWKIAVKDLNVQPDIAWALDFVDIRKLLDVNQTNIDTSIMLNFERVNNGASKEWLQSHS